MSDNSADDPNVLISMQVEEVPPAKFYDCQWQLVLCIIKVCTSVHHGCLVQISSLSPPPFILHLQVCLHCLYWEWLKVRLSTISHTAQL